MLVGNRIIGVRVNWRIAAEEAKSITYQVIYNMKWMQRSVRSRIESKSGKGRERDD